MAEEVAVVHEHVHIDGELGRNVGEVHTGSSIEIGHLNVHSCAAATCETLARARDWPETDPEGFCHDSTVELNSWIAGVYGVY